MSLKQTVFQCGGRHGADIPRPGLCAGTGVINRYTVLETAFSQEQNVIVPNSEHSGPWP